MLQPGGGHDSYGANATASVGLVERRERAGEWCRWSSFADDDHLVQRLPFGLSSGLVSSEEVDVVADDLEVTVSRCRSRIKVRPRRQGDLGEGGEFRRSAGSVRQWARAIIGVLCHPPLLPARSGALCGQLNSNAGKRR